MSVASTDSSLISFPSLVVFFHSVVLKPKPLESPSLLVAPPPF
ncbi:hypothetical protein [Brachyspira aalborgi]|nr:hypothetical protein [Brachyspira aalborgi]